LTVEFLKQGKEVTAIDSSDFALEILKDRCKAYKDKVKVQTMDVQKLDFADGTFDGACSMFVIPFVDDNLKYFSEVYRVLKKGGKFSISAWAPVPEKFDIPPGLKALALLDSSTSFRSRDSCGLA